MVPDKSGPPMIYGRQWRAEYQDGWVNLIAMISVYARNMLALPDQTMKDRVNILRYLGSFQHELISGDEFDDFEVWEVD